MCACVLQWYEPTQVAQGSRLEAVKLCVMLVPADVDALATLVTGGLGAFGLCAGPVKPAAAPVVTTASAAVVVVTAASTATAAAAAAAAEASGTVIA